MRSALPGHVVPLYSLDHRCLITIEIGYFLLGHSGLLRALDDRTGDSRGHVHFKGAGYYVICIWILHERRDRVRGRYPHLSVYRVGPAVQNYTEYSREREDVVHLILVFGASCPNNSSTGFLRVFRCYLRDRISESKDNRRGSHRTNVLLREDAGSRCANEDIGSFDDRGEIAFLFLRVRCLSYLFLESCEILSVARYRSLRIENNNFFDSSG